MEVEGWVMSAYDYLCTFKQEVDYVWSCPWAPALPLFYLNRYLPFVDQVILLQRLALKPLHVVPFYRIILKACLIEGSLAICVIYPGLFNIGSIISQSWCDLYIKRTGSIQFIVNSHYYTPHDCLLGDESFHWICLGLCRDLYFPITHCQDSPLDFPARGCPVRGASDKISALYITIFLIELLIVILTAIKALSHVRQSRSSWVKEIYRDGIGLFFCVCMLCITFINIVVPRLCLPLELKGIFTLPQRVLHSIVCNRVVLQILKCRAESPPPLTPNNHGSRSRSAYGNNLEIFTSVQPITSFTTTDEVELDSASILEREGWIG
ncbi:uncharacterized protein LACBIDRAFT_316183 [Laccaria bicolor S238N-H82]|uniref:Predicted protein n=1 Tax=Laccaria bicolor (strain S238N-H82 / ATCC MYA-4686) TaxID=486041 RepID=B0E0D3_LACBS|nr:uncharacterized protein LACBIDRAFT_316183 [Laccaria bicolor S238N-H82]EDQ99665.1 predicted protein [Laccaria bicolor S238N-H82]|eukprot:XP_001889642.1 predicted protein [Laccaria bicolor S238N-H82]